MADDTGLPSKDYVWAALGYRGLLFRATWLSRKAFVFELGSLDGRVSREENGARGARQTRSPLHAVQLPGGGCCGASVTTNPMIPQS